MQKKSLLQLDWFLGDSTSSTVLQGSAKLAAENVPSNPIPDGSATSSMCVSLAIWYKE